jgi:Rrf2 family protein
MFSTTTEHALRALVHMARLPEGVPILGRDLAKRAQIPPNYLSKILWTLRNAGYVETLRGQGGGYRLARASRRIKLSDIAELFEGTRSKPGCLIGEKYDCTDRSFCSAHAQWKEVKRSYSIFLESNTIADIA